MVVSYILTQFPNDVRAFVASSKPLVDLPVLGLASSVLLDVPRMPVHSEEAHRRLQRVLEPEERWRLQTSREVHNVFFADFARYSGLLFILFQRYSLGVVDGANHGRYPFDCSARCSGNRDVDSALVICSGADTQQDKVIFMYLITGGKAGKILRH